MYEKLDKYIMDSDLDSGYWYDMGVDEAIEIIEKFDDKDWAKLEENIIHKDLDWKIKYSYCAGCIQKQYALKSLIKLSNTDNIELFEVVIDSLRDLIENSLLEIVIDESLVKKVKNLLPKCDKVQKIIFEEFIKKCQFI